jgi:glucose/arabinose dehydrogenase
MTRTRYIIISFILLLIVLSTSIFVYVKSGPEVNVGEEFSETYLLNPDFEITEWVTGLEVPWGIVFLDEETALVTERPGRIRIIQNGILLEEPYLEINADARGEGGLMGIEKHPDFPNTQHIYVMYTTTTDNRVSKIIHNETKGIYSGSILEGLEKSANHNGGRIKFGPDGYLYITTGEQFRASRSQDKNSLSGKILRITDEGNIPNDNPFGNEVYSLGHRNPQGLAWLNGELYISEHGPSGEFGILGHDEINKVEKGKNYGWPEVVGYSNNTEFENPLFLFKDATPPAGITFHEEFLYVATLRSRSLLKIDVENRIVTRLFNDGETNTYGRIRDVISHNGYLYVATSNRDGRGTPNINDDKILRIRIN